MVFKMLYIVCPACLHRNRKDPSPRRNIRAILQARTLTCNGCGYQFDFGALRDTPLVRKVREELKAEGRAVYH